MQTHALRFTCVACHKTFVVEDWDELVQLRTLEVFRESREGSAEVALDTDSMLDLTCPRCACAATYKKSDGEPVDNVNKSEEPVIRPKREDIALETLRSMATGSIGTIEVAARQVITVAAILIGVYFNASEGRDLATHSVSVRLLFLTPVVSWIASLICSGMALHPQSWQVRMTNEKDAEEDIERIRKHKYAWYMWAVSLLVMGTFCLLLVMVFQLILLP